MPSQRLFIVVPEQRGGVERRHYPYPLALEPFATDLGDPVLPPEYMPDRDSAETYDYLRRDKSRLPPQIGQAQQSLVV